MFPSLIDNCGSEQLRRVEIAHRESVEPGLLPARQAMQLCAANVPQLDVHTVGAALAEEENWHWAKSSGRENKRQKSSGILGSKRSGVDDASL